MVLGPDRRGRSRRAGAVTFLVAVALIASHLLAQTNQAGPPVRIDFSGSRAATAASAVPVATGTSGPAVRIDFQGSRALAAVAQAAPTGVAGPAVRIDFSGSRPLPAAPRK